jgi:hypothetical protein
MLCLPSSTLLRGDRTATIHGIFLTPWNSKRCGKIEKQNWERPSRSPLPISHLIHYSFLQHRLSGSLQFTSYKDRQAALGQCAFCMAMLEVSRYSEPDDLGSEITAL